MVTTEKLMLQKIYISFKYLCCDQENCQVSLNNSIPNKFNSPNPIKTSTIQFIFIIQIFNESIQLCIRFKIEAQNFFKKKKISPKLSIMLYRRQNSINQRRVYCPLLSLVHIGSLNVEIPLCVDSYCPTRNIRTFKQ